MMMSHLIWGYNWRVAINQHHDYGEDAPDRSILALDEALTARSRLAAR
jgi:hypothetical protein